MDAGTVPCLTAERQWPGATHRERWLHHTMSNLTRVICIFAVLFTARGIATATWETHDWTVRVNGTSYGLQEMYDLPNQRTTLLHYGRDTHRIIRAPIYGVALTCIAIVSIPPALVVYFYARRRHHRKAA
jgi:hypothetical protein